jgi:hypothetical protein
MFTVLPESPSQEFPGTVFAPGRTPFYPDARYRIFVPGGNVTWSLGGSTATAGVNGLPCSYHIFVDKDWVSADGRTTKTPPPDLPANYRIVITGEIATDGTNTTFAGTRGECTYPRPGGVPTAPLDCVFDNPIPPALDNLGVWLQNATGRTYTVTEENLPAPWTSSNTGRFTLPTKGCVPGAVPGYPGINKYCLHTITNRLPTPTPTITPGGPTLTPAPSATPTATATATCTATVEPSATPSATTPANVTPTPTSTLTPTLTATASPTSSPCPTATNTPGGGGNGGGGGGNEPTRTPTPTATVTATVTSTPPPPAPSPGPAETEPATLAPSPPAPAATQTAAAEVLAESQTPPQQTAVAFQTAVARGTPPAQLLPGLPGTGTPPPAGTSGGAVAAVAAGLGLLVAGAAGALRRRRRLAQ